MPSFVPAYVALTIKSPSVNLVLGFNIFVGLALTDMDSKAFASSHSAFNVIFPVTLSAGSLPSDVNLQALHSVAALPSSSTMGASKYQPKNKRVPYVGSSGFLTKSP